MQSFNHLNTIYVVTRRGESCGLNKIMLGRWSLTLKGLSLIDLWAWEDVGEREGRVAARRAVRRERIHKQHAIRLSTHPADVWRATQKLLPETHISWLHTHTGTHTDKHTLPRSPFLLAPSLIHSLTTFSFLMVHLSAAIMTKLLSYTALHSQCKCLFVFICLYVAL